jgi:hypothetical protein
MSSFLIPTDLEKENFIKNYKDWYTGYYLSGLNLKNRALVNSFNTNYRIQISKINEFLKKYYKDNKNEIDKIAIKAASDAKAEKVKIQNNIFVDLKTLRKMLLEVMKLSDQKNMIKNNIVIQQYDDRISNLNNLISNIKNKMNLDSFNTQVDLANEDYYIILSRSESKLTNKKNKTTNDMSILNNIQTLKNNLVRNNPTLFTNTKIVDLTTKSENLDYIVQEYFTYEGFTKIVGVH